MRKIHWFRQWVRDLLEYDVEKEEALTWCGRVVKGSQTNLDGEPKNVTCKQCLGC